MAKTVELKRIVEKMNLKNLTPDVELNDKEVEVPDINRPAPWRRWTRKRKGKFTKPFCLIKFPALFSAAIFRRSRCFSTWR